MPPCKQKNKSAANAAHQLHLRAYTVIPMVTQAVERICGNEDVCLACPCVFISAFAADVCKKKPKKISGNAALIKEKGEQNYEIPHQT